jgi:hypothetical protein
MRDRDVRNAIHDALIATGDFDAVYLWGSSGDHATAASKNACATIEPESSAQEDCWDAATGGGLIVTSRVTITLLNRQEDPELRDEAAELLLDTVANALNGQCLAGLTMPQHTRIVSWRWEEPAPPERRIAATLSYRYIVEGWDSYDTTP